MQAVYDANCKFLGVAVRFVGFTNDNTCFENCSLSKTALELPQLYHWVGDNAYVDSPYMITPYLGNNLHVTHPAKDSFNFWHSQIRITIERCFGIFVMGYSLETFAAKSAKDNEDS